MATYEVYKVRRDYGRMYIRNMQNEYLSAEEIAGVIKELSDLHALMTSAKVTQSEVLSQDLSDRLRNVERDMRIEYPFHHEFAAYIRGKSRRSSAQRFCGVYFLRLHGRPDVIKIGHSIDLYARTKQFWLEYKREVPDGNPKFEIVAFAHTDNGYETERMFHQFFKADQVDGEWFRTDAVIAWLKRVSA